MNKLTVKNKREIFPKIAEVFQAMAKDNCKHKNLT